jgi:hypothetical protein
MFLTWSAGFQRFRQPPDLVSHWLGGFADCTPYHRTRLLIGEHQKANHIHFYVTDGNILYLTDASRFLISCVIQHYAPEVGWGGGWRNTCIMLIMTLAPRWRQTLRVPPPGIEPGSPVSQAGTLPKELSKQLIPVLRIRDVYPRSRILIFSHPGSKTATKERGETLYKTF